MIDNTAYRAAGRMVFSVSCCGFVGALCLMVLSTIWPEQEYFFTRIGQSLLFCVLVFFGVRLGIEYKPMQAGVALEVAEKQYEATRLNTDAKALRFAATVPPVASGQAAIIEHGAVPAKNTEAWRSAIMGVMERVVSGSVKAPYYRGGLDAVMSYECWRTVFCPIATELRLIEPIVSGQRTSWREGISAFSAMRLLADARITAPLPPFYEMTTDRNTALETPETQ
jgi:hypothetical protein